MQHIFIFITFCSTAQTSKGWHEVSGGVGKVTGQDIYYFIAYVPDTRDPAYKRYKAVFNLSYKYYVTDQLAVGISFTQHSFEESWFDLFGLVQYYNYYDACTINAEVKYNVLNERHCQIYFSGGAGVFIQKNSSHFERQKYYNSNKISPSFYASPFGIRVGGRIGAFAEIGIGYKGMYHAGASFLIGREPKL